MTCQSRSPNIFATHLPAFTTSSHPARRFCIIPAQNSRASPIGLNVLKILLAPSSLIHYALPNKSTQLTKYSTLSHFLFYNFGVFSRQYLNRGAYATVLRPSVVCLYTECIVAKRCVPEQKLLLTAYSKSYMRNQLVPNKWPWPLFRGRIKVTSIIALHSTLNISETVIEIEAIGSKGPPIEMAYGESNGHVIDDGWRHVILNGQTREPTASIWF